MRTRYWLWLGAKQTNFTAVTEVCTAPNFRHSPTLETNRCRATTAEGFCERKTRADAVCAFFRLTGGILSVDDHVRPSSEPRYRRPASRRQWLTAAARRRNYAACPASSWGGWCGSDRSLCRVQGQPHRLLVGLRRRGGRLDAGNLSHSCSAAHGAGSAVEQGRRHSGCKGCVCRG